MKKIVHLCFPFAMKALIPVKMGPNLKRRLTAALVSVVCCYLVGDGGNSFAQGTLNIDLIDERFEGKPLSSLRLEDVTARLGSPSASFKLPELVGVQLYYHDLGLAFLFRTEPNKRFLSLDLYLSKLWDSPRRMFFEPYVGTLVPSVNANSTLEQVVEELNRQSSPRGLSIKENRRKLGLEGRLTPVYVVDFKGKNGNLRFFNERTTRLLKEISATIPNIL